MNKQLRILKGLHHGAIIEIGAQERHLIGSDAQCSVVMCDSGLAPKHCVIGNDDYGMTCRALEGAVSIDGTRLEPGEACSLDDFAIIRCGDAAFSVGPVAGDWSIATRAVQAQANTPRSAMRYLQRLNPYALFVLVTLGIGAVISVAYATLSGTDDELVTNRVEAARRWLKGVAPPGSELTVGIANPGGRELLLSGYVLSARQVKALDKASGSLREGLRFDVHAVEGLLAAAARIAQLARVDCDPTYKGSGRVACRKPAPDDTAAVRLRSLARDVPGLRAIEIDIDASPVAVAAVTAPSPPPSEPPRLTQKFAVFMFRNQRMLIGPYGERYREGEQFDGFRIERIGLDKVTFARDGRQFEFYVAALRTASR
jgi:hypothetical protein